MKEIVKYTKPECVTPGKLYITGERYCDDRFVGFLYHFGKLPY